MQARVPALDLLRLVAVLGVVLFHYGFRGPTGLEKTYVALPELAAFARYGFLGVPAFFVISGFVIAYSAEGRSATEFAVARFARIYPTFVLCMTATFLAVLLFGSPEFQASFAQWAANLLIVAPGSRYVDSAYWSLVVEAIFYAWVALFIWLGLFQRRADVIIAIWLGISLLTEMTVDARWINKLLVADYSGFFATGILLYQLRKGRRDLALQCLLATAVMVAVYQAAHSLDWLRGETGAPFDDAIVAAICLASILVIMLATHIRELPVGTGVLVAAGGMTYPLYLLHQQLGYVLLQRLEGEPCVVAGLVVLLIGGISWAMWRFVERPMQSFAKKALTIFADRTGIVVRRPPAARPLN
jgi:peptidoglycan/LPS O-acetylase OafA/YrhL